LTRPDRNHTLARAHRAPPDEEAPMIVESLRLTPEQFAAGTGWQIKPEGACRADMCVPLNREAGFDLQDAAQRLGMALVPDGASGLWALGPASLGGRALGSAEAPELVLEDLAGQPFRLSSLRGQKVVLVAWAPY
jgi:hypothetical protein